MCVGSGGCTHLPGFEERSEFPQIEERGCVSRPGQILLITGCVCVCVSVWCLYFCPSPPPPPFQLPGSFFPSSHVPSLGGLGKGLSGHQALKAKQGKEAGVRGHRKSSPWGRGQRAPWEGRGHWGLSYPGSSQPAPSPDTPLHSTHRV